jgi:hypothetical protein
VKRRVSWRRAKAQIEAVAPKEKKMQMEQRRAPTSLNVTREQKLREEKRFYNWM